MNTNLKEEATKAMAAAVKRTVQIGDTLRIWMGTTDEIEHFKPTIEAEIKRALIRGDTVKENGVVRWMEENEVRDSSKTGSDAYTWSKDGNSVKVEKVLVTKQCDGTILRQTIGFAWRKWA